MNTDIICPYYRKHELVTITCQRGDPTYKPKEKGNRPPIKYAIFNDGHAMFMHMKNACRCHYTACKKYQELQKSWGNGL